MQMKIESFSEAAMQREENKPKSSLTKKQIEQRARNAKCEMARRNKKKAQGLCTDAGCLEPSIGSGWACEKHASVRAERNKRRKQRMRMRGLCSYGCGKKSTGGRWTCDDHRKLREGWTRFERYGMTKAQYDEMFAAQDGCCAVCRGSSKRFHIDHDHITGAVRGVLCHQCNIAIGMVNDDDARLRALADYVVLHRELARFPMAV